MIPIDNDSLVATFLIFCRIGSCLMVVPGFAQMHVPPQVRLFVALGVTLALTPLLIGDPLAAVRGSGLGDTVRLIVSEILTGLLIGIIGRFFFLALQTILVVITQSIGLSPLPGSMVEDSEPLPPMASIFSLAAATMMFASDLHWELLRGLVASYKALPVGLEFGARIGLNEIADHLSEAFVVALRIGSPFVVYAVIVNFGIGLTNKLVPNIPIFFIATPFITAGGLLLMFFTAREFLTIFMGAFAAWLQQG